EVQYRVWCVLLAVRVHGQRRAVRGGGLGWRRAGPARRRRYPRFRVAEAFREALAECLCHGDGGVWRLGKTMTVCCWLAGCDAVGVGPTAGMLSWPGGHPQDATVRHRVRPTIEAHAGGVLEHLGWRATRRRKPS